MQEVELTKYLAMPGNSQQQLADAVGFRQSAISNMKKSGRSIFVVLDDSKKVVEIREEKVIARPNT